MKALRVYEACITIPAFAPWCKCMVLHVSLCCGDDYKFPVPVLGHYVCKSWFAHFLRQVEWIKVANQARPSTAEWIGLRVVMKREVLFLWQTA